MKTKAEETTPVPTAEQFVEAVSRCSAATISSCKKMSATSGSKEEAAYKALFKLIFGRAPTREELFQMTN